MKPATPRVHVYAGDIFDVVADTLICSANVFLTLSGGVGGELLRRFGDPMQKPLVDHMHQLGKRHVPQGTVVATDGGPSPWQTVLHAVCVDGMYDSTPGVVAKTLSTCWDLTAAHGGKHASLPALATGYGHLTHAQFGEGLITALRAPNTPAQISVALPDPHHAAELRAQLQDAGVVSAKDKTSG